MVTHVWVLLVETESGDRYSFAFTNQMGWEDTDTYLRETLPFEYEDGRYEFPPDYRWVRLDIEDNKD